MSVLRHLLVLLFLVGGRALEAQSLAYFEPGRRVADGLELGYAREHAGTRSPGLWPTSAAGWIFLRESGTQSNFEAGTPRAEDARAWTLTLAGDGAALVGWDLPPRVEETSVGALRAFLGERGGAQALPLLGPDGRRANELVRLTRLESLALHVPGRSADGTVLSKSGQRMELRALLDPSTSAAGSDLVFKLYLPPGGDQGVFCRAQQLATGTTMELTRLADGVVRARLETAGPWRLEAHRLRRLEGELELASTTLVFELPAAKAGGR